MKVRFGLACLLLIAAPLAARAAEFTVEKSEAGVQVKIDGKLFTEYVKLSGSKPILWPIIGPTGIAMTRAYPMKMDVEGERKDHPHHRSLWFTHMEVNGVNFWAEAASFTNPKKSADQTAKLGTTVHREFKQTEATKDGAVIVAVNDWIGPDGKKVLEDERRITIHATEDMRSIDFDIDLKATEVDLLWGDNKDGVFGVRIPTSMDVDSKQGGKIVNSSGLNDKDAWGKPANWVDYHGPVEGQHLGVAILDHPTSFRHPTPWHVRTYGLFAANAFGLNDFNPSAGVNGDHTQKKGETLKFRFRVIFHKGDEKQGKIAEAYEAYAKESK